MLLPQQSTLQAGAHVSAGPSGGMLLPQHTGPDDRFAAAPDRHGGAGIAETQPGSNVSANRGVPSKHCSSSGVPREVGLPGGPSAMTNLAAEDGCCMPTVEIRSDQVVESLQAAFGVRDRQSQAMATKAIFDATPTGDVTHSLMTSFGCDI